MGVEAVASWTLPDHVLLTNPAGKPRCGPPARPAVEEDGLGQSSRLPFHGEETAAH